MARRIRLDLMSAVNLPQTGNGVAQDWPGGDGVFLCEAATGATINLQIQAPGGAWINVINYATTADMALAANKMGNFRACAGPIRVAAGIATGVIASVVGVPSNTAG